MTKSQLFLFTCKDSRHAARFGNRAANHLQALLASDELGLSESQKESLDRLFADKRLFQDCVASVFGYKNWREFKEEHNHKKCDFRSSTDEELTTEDLQTRRKSQVSALSALLAQHEIGNVDCAGIISKWQPTARNPHVDAYTQIEKNLDPENYFINTVPQLKELIQKIRTRFESEESQNLSDSDKKLLFEGIRRFSMDGSNLINCDIACIAVRFANQKKNEALSTYGRKLLEQLSALGDPYSCIQMGEILFSDNPSRETVKRAFELVNRGIQQQESLTLRESIAKAYLFAAKICLSEYIEHKGLADVINYFRLGVDHGSAKCAANLSFIYAGEIFSESDQFKGLIDFQQSLEYGKRALSLSRMSDDPDNKINHAEMHQHLELVNISLEICKNLEMKEGEA